MTLDPAAIYDVTTRKARKRHQCTACLCAIQPGERYDQHAYLAGGRWRNEKACADCAALVEECRDDIDGIAPCPSALYEWVVEGDLTEKGRAFCERRSLAGGGKAVRPTVPPHRSRQR